MNFVIIGNGIAGFAAAAAIRENQADAQIRLVSEERESSYIRPLLSKGSFKSVQREKIRIAPENWYKEQRIEEILGQKVQAIDRKKKSVRLSDGRELSYDKCIYSAGASCFVPPFPGREKSGVMTVRNLVDFNAIRRNLVRTKRAVIIGGGVIGLETAWQLTGMGCEVTVLEAGPRLMGRLLDERSACVLKDQVRESGIQARAGVQITEITGTDRANGVRLSDESWYPAELVIISCGVRANIGLAKEAGLSCDRGLLVDDQLRSSDPDIYGAGDCIQWWGPNPGLWNYARISGTLAGENASRRGEGKNFVPRTEYVLMEICGSWIFSGGNVQEGAEVETKEFFTRTGKHTPRVQAFSGWQTAAPGFLVNPRETGTVRYKKCFYREGRLCGAVLIGDLTEMEQLKCEMNGG